MVIRARPMAITGGSRDQAVAWNGLTYSAASSPAARAPVVMARTAMTSTASRGSQFLLFLILFPSILQLGPAQPNFAQTKNHERRRAHGKAGCLLRTEVRREKTSG